MRGTQRFSAFFLLFCLTSSWAWAQESGSSPHIFCYPDKSLPTDGDRALAAKNFSLAKELFTATLAQNSSDNDARLGLIRAHLGANEPLQASTESSRWLHESPGNTLGEIAAGEVAYYAADIAATQKHAEAAIRDNHCEGRALSLTAKISYLDAQFTRQASLLKIAHQLRPYDELIQREWIFTLPWAERITALDDYLSDSANLSNIDWQNYVTEEEDLKSHHPGECRIEQKFESTTVPLKPIDIAQDRTTSYTLNVSFNGSTRHLALDTGASGLVLTAAAAKKLGLHPEFYLQSTGAGSSAAIRSYRTHVASIQIGDLQFSDCQVEVLEKSALKVDGLIGANLFAPWLVTIDYPNEELSLKPLPHRPGENEKGEITGSDLEDVYQVRDRYIAPEMSDWLRVLRVRHLLLVPARLDSSDLHYFIVDTGSSQTTLSLALARGTHREYVEFDTHYFDISGDINNVYRVDHAVLHFGPFQLPPASYEAFDYSNIRQQTGLEVSGLLGLPTLSAMTISIDFRDNLMQLAYGVKRTNGFRAGR